MQTLIQGGKYQILEVIEAKEGYRVCLCIDVETDNQYKPMIFNIYEKDEYIKRLLPVFYTAGREQNSEFVRIMTGPHSFIAAFEYHQGERLRDYFQKVDRNDFESRAQYASLLLERCLVLDTMEDFIACSCLEPENIVVSGQSQRVMINFFIRPDEDAVGLSKSERLALLMECIFIKNRYVPDELWEYIAELKQNREGSIVTAYARWKELNAPMLEEYQRYKKESFAAYLLRRLKKLLKIRKKAN